MVKRWELEEKKRKFKAMTPEEKRAYLADQRRLKRENESQASFPKKEEKHEDLQLPQVASKYVRSLIS